MEAIEIVTLQPSEWKLYKDLRLRALKEEPQAYTSTYEEMVTTAEENWRQRLVEAEKGEHQWMIFAKRGEELVGMGTAFRIGESEKATIAAVYVAPEVRGKGISKQIMEKLISQVQQSGKVKKLEVCVNSEMEPAYNLYKKSGFTVYKEQKAKLGDGNEHLCYEMEREL